MRSSYRVPMKQRDIPDHGKGPIVAYDLETTRIPRDPSDPLSVEPKFLTMFGKKIRVADRTDTFEELGAALLSRMLLPELVDTRFVAWNANRFDVRLIMQAIINASDEFTITPYIAKQGGLRGVKVSQGERAWYFLDGMSMLGLQCSLKKFLDVFAPKFKKHELDLEHTEFDADNPEHVAYAERDSEGLYWGMQQAERILHKLTGRGAQTTIGSAGIKCFVSNLPEKAICYALRKYQREQVERVVMRGGYVYVARQYDGPAWSYDVNQAYAAAMREQDLPSGATMDTNAEIPNLLGIYTCTISRKPLSVVPFYVKTLQGEALECYGEATKTILCSNEIRCLRRHGWRVDVHKGFVWQAKFRMQKFVDRLERLRRKHPAGTPINVMCKALGNNAYGKMNEHVPNTRFIIARNQPENALPYNPGDPLFKYIWVQHEEGDQGKFYHRPHVAAFITAAVRCKLFDAIMLAPDDFLKADTDSVCFTRPVKLPISEWKYGRWKLESEGERHIIIGKKVYARFDGKERAWKFVCKGLHTKRLTVADFERWFKSGKVPEQQQMQLLSFKSSSLAPSYRPVKRKGTNFAKIAPHTVERKKRVRTTRTNKRTHRKTARR